MKYFRMSVAAWAMLSLVTSFVPTPTAHAADDEPASASPVDLIFSDDGAWLFTANQTADSVSVINVEKKRAVQEIACGAHPTALAIAPDGRLLVTCAYGQSLESFRWNDGKLVADKQIRVGGEPWGVGVHPDGTKAYVALAMDAVIAVIDLQSFQITNRIPVGPTPRYLAVAPDGKRLAVGCNGDRTVSVVDLEAEEQLFSNAYGGINAGHMQISADGKDVYFPWMIYRTNPINPRTIRLGWVLGTRIARINLYEDERRYAITLDPPGEAVSDPHGLALSDDEQWMVATGSGTHELLVYQLPGLPFQSVGGPGDHIDRELLFDRQRFYRIPLGGRPMGVRFAPDQRHVYVANYLTDSVQVVDLESRRVTDDIFLGGPLQETLVRRGEAVFYDARHSLDQWYSCHSCHYEGGSNAVTMDTTNDGSEGTFKTVLNLYRTTRTGPWTWHGWQQDLESAVTRSMTETMKGPQPTTEDIAAIIAYLDSLEPPPSPYRQPDGSLSEAAKRGQTVFQSEQAGCAHCHSGPNFTDGEIHDVGLGSESDVYQGFNTPSLLGVARKARLLHHGRAKSLEEALTGDHNPAKVTGLGELKPTEVADLIEYLKSL